jgi:anti-sigma regulatory factor (Ser/Thr protein kinase)
MLYSAPLSPPRRFNADIADLANLLADCRAACLMAGLDTQAMQRVELVIEEAFSNSVHHGYGGNSHLPVWLSHRILPDGLELVYQDAAPPFDPLHEAALPTDQRPGGVGRVLMKTLPGDASYALVAGRNTLSFRFHPTY